MFYCEDNACVAIPPPGFFAILVTDPTRPGVPPYWERPANLPTPVLQDLFTALIANATSTQASNLYALVAPWVAATCTSACVSKCGP